MQTPKVGETWVRKSPRAVNKEVDILKADDNVVWVYDGKRSNRVLRYVFNREYKKKNDTGSD